MRILDKLLNRPPYPRPLTEDERRFRIDQQQSLDAKPRDYCRVVRINSTYLEIVGREHTARGFSAGAGVFLAPLFFLLAGVSVFGAWTTFFDEYVDMPAKLAMLAFAALIFAGSIVMLWVCTSGMRHEIGKFTHYPIRFNRRNRKVYALCRNGDASVFLWDDLHFCFDRMPFRTAIDRFSIWGIRANELDESGETVVDGFALPVACETPFLAAAFWEFVRSYMEKGPESLPDVAFYVPLAPDMDTFSLAIYNAKPPFGGGYRLDDESHPSLLGWWLIRKLGRPPEWPAKVEEECGIEPDDPFRRDAAGQERFTNATLHAMMKADSVFYADKLDRTRVDKRLKEMYGGTAFDE